MSLLLPQNPVIREKFDMMDLAEKRWITLKDARNSARNTFENIKLKGVPGSIRALFYLVLRANGDVHLMRFGPRGGKSTLWNFGSA